MYICFTTESRLLTALCTKLISKELTADRWPLIAFLQIAALYNIQLTEQIADTW